MIFRLVFLLLLSMNLRAQTFHAAPFQGMGNTGLAIESVYSLSNNPAGIGTLDKAAIALAYQPHFMTNDLRSQAFYLTAPVKNVGSFGLGMHNYGIANVSSFLTASMSYVKSFGGIISSSISANYHRFYVKNYESDQTFSLDLGALIKISNQVNIGMVFRNASFSKFQDDTDQYLPMEAGIGVLYTVSDELSLAVDTYYEYERHMNVRGGLSYSIGNVVFLRAGIASDPTQYFAGIGLKFKSFQFDVSSSFHHRLGSSPQFALAYEF